MLLNIWPWSFCASTLLLVWLLAGTAWPEAGSAGDPSTADPAGAPVAATGAQGIDKETIVIRADRAWEEPDTEQVLHFEGDFELISPDWELRADEADLYGPLDDPERIVARGLPAVVTILSADETVVGEGRTIEYQRDTDVLTLTEDARVIGEKVSMKSARIVYDLGAERLVTSGTEGVEMVLERDAR